jgi:probable rRNA maturation factor
MTRSGQQPASLSSQKTMALQKLQLSLQFGDVPYAARHRTALPRHFVARCIRHALSDDAEITVRIVSEAEGHALNHSYRRKDYATNVLTFDYAQVPIVIADIVLCAPVVAAEAKAQGKTLQAHYAHLLVHGTLHAQGWDHETSAKDAREMEAYEVDILAGLGFKNPYLA